MCLIMETGRIALHAQLHTGSKRAISIIMIHTSCIRVVRVALRRDKTRVVYTSPLKALSNQKYRELYEEFRDVSRGRYASVCWEARRVGDRGAYRGMAVESVGHMGSGLPCMPAWLLGIWAAGDAYSW